MANVVKCPLCKEKCKNSDGLYDHIMDDHDDEIPEGMSPQQYLYYVRTGKTHGSCVECHKPTEWNPSTNKYHRFCNNPKCKEKYVARFKKRMIGKYGKTTLLDDPEQQKIMLSHRKISGEYKWTDGSKKTYTGSYELDFLKFLDVLMNFDSSDIMTPSPHTYYYMYEGKNHFYIPDVYIPSLNLEIEIKDGGDNPNKHHKIQEVDKVKEKLKDEVMNSQKSIDYIKIVDKKYANFINYLLKRKDEMISNKTILKEDSSFIDIEEPTEESIIYKSLDLKMIKYVIESDKFVDTKPIKTVINKTNFLLIGKKLSRVLKYPVTVHIYDDIKKFTSDITNADQRLLRYPNDKLTLVGHTVDHDIYVLTEKELKKNADHVPYKLYLEHEMWMVMINEMNPNCQFSVATSIATVLSGELEWCMHNDMGDAFGLSQAIAVNHVYNKHGIGAIKNVIRSSTSGATLIKYINESTEESDMLFNHDIKTLTENGMNPNKKYPVYVILFSNDTSFGKLIRKVTGSEYSHACVSLDPSMNNMYSFSSIPYNHAQFGEGFVRESLWSPMFQENRYFTVMVTFVDKEGYKEIKKKIEYFKKNYTKYRYNDLGLIKYYLNFKERKFHNEKYKKKYFCSEFVAYMLKTADFVEYDDIMLAPEEIIERSLTGKVLGDYTIPNFSEKKLIRETEKAYRELIEEEFDDYYNEHLNESVSIVEEGRLKELGKQWASSIEKWWFDGNTTKYTALIDWKRLYKEFTSLFKYEDPDIRFDLIELIVKRYLIPMNKNADKATELIIKELHNIYNRFHQSFNDFKIYMVSVKDGIIGVKTSSKKSLFNYPTDVSVRENSNEVDELIESLFDFIEE